MTTTPQKTMISKLADVQTVVKSVPKAGYNEHFKYHFAREADVLDTLQHELASRQIMLIPSIVEETREKLANSSTGKERHLTRLSMTFTFYDGECGETLSFPWLSWGVDGEDKGGYKAITGAMKYFLLKTFLIPTHDDPEATTSESVAAGLKVEGDVVTDMKTGETVTLPEGYCLITAVTEKSGKKGDPFWPVSMTGIDRTNGGGLTTITLTTFESRVKTLAEMYRGKLIPVHPGTKKSKDGKYTNLIGLTERREADDDDDRSYESYEAKPYQSDIKNTEAGRKRDVDEALGDAVEGETAEAGPDVGDGPGGQDGPPAGAPNVDDVDFATF